MAISNLTDIANYALNSINAGSIMSIDGSDRISGICKKYIDLAIVQALSDGEYTSTRYRSDLTLRTDISRPDYSYCYHLPSNYVKGIELESGAGYEIETMALFTNDTAPRLLYIRKLDNIGQYGPFIVDCIALTLATMICVEVKGDTNLMAATLQQLRLMTRRAKAHDKSEKNGQKGKPASWSDWNASVETW